MKLVRKSIEKDRSGYVTLYPEEAEDMWHVYNLLLVGDQLRAQTIRRVVTESATGSTDSSRIRMTLTLTVDKIDFDVQGGALHVAGKTVSENKHVRLGSHHTLDLELHRNFTIIKAEWDSVALERIQDACDVSKSAEIAAVVMQEGLANICLLTQHMTIVRQRIETPVPRKRKGSTTNHEKGLVRFYDQVYQAMLRHVDLDIVKVIIVASPGFVKDQYFQYVFEQAVKTENKQMLSSRSKFLLLHSSSGHKHSLAEVLADPSVAVRLANTKYAREQATLDQFYKVLGEDEARAWYGEKEVKAAVERGAVGTLMISDELFRSANPAKRRYFAGMVDSVKALGGTVLIFSSLHASGERRFTLRYALYCLTF